jgi:hypothetical protein
MSSKEIFELRRNGDLMAGYNLGKKLLEVDPSDAWVLKAFAYCALDLANAASQRSEYSTAQQFIAEVNSLKAILSDNILVKSIRKAEALANPSMKVANEAAQASRAGNRAQALELYRSAIIELSDNQDVAIGLAWELYHQLNTLTANEAVNVNAVRRLLAEYINLKNERPSNLHSRILRIAQKLSDQDGFNYVAFVKLWDLKNLTDDDYQNFTAQNGIKYPSLAEKSIQKAARRAERQDNNLELINYLLPFLDDAIERFVDNNWLVYYKAKLLHKIGSREAALSFTTKFVRSKLTDFWSWDLLADVVLENGDSEVALSCCCKSLLCRTDEDFLGKIRLKLASILIKQGLLENAKYEIEQVLANYTKNGWRLQESLASHLNSDWYASTKAVKSNKNFYRENETKADELAFGDKPWLKGVLGDIFETNQSPPNKRRNIYVSLDDSEFPIEISIPEKKYDFSGMSVRDTILVKGELDANNRFNVFLIKPANSFNYLDIFKDLIGVIDHINSTRGVFHFMVDRNINGLMNISDCGFNVSDGDVVALKIFKYHSADLEPRYKAISCSATNIRPSSELISDFSELVEHTNNGLAFTHSGIFIDRNLVEKYKIIEGDCVQGKSILNFNRRRSIWGRKAVGILTVIKTEGLEKYSDEDDQFYEELAAPFLEDLN